MKGQKDFYEYERPRNKQCAICLKKKRVAQMFFLQVPYSVKDDDFRKRTNTIRICNDCFHTLSPNEINRIWKENKKSNKIEKIYDTKEGAL